ncbi:MAG: 16S rRNA (cytosine(1402)-N(4))-methyltransferase RsmH [bacterium]|nr:16S rRNA (cytosine(1402)-N(4))-methyltransferase RsmH [bacterium]
MESVHIPVLLHEIIEGFEPVTKQDPIYLDGTLGGAGHALSIAKAFEGKITVVGLDRDMQAISRAQETLKDSTKNLILVNEDFRNLDKVLEAHILTGVDMILLDLGISSDELDNSGRGFTFQKDEPLLMTMGDPEKYPFTAKDIVNKWSEEVLADIIFGYGEERYARRIAKGIVLYRDKKLIETSGELAEIIKSSVPVFYKRSKIHPATRSFQALRIAVNDELNALREGLVKGYEHLNPKGRMAVISFHSLEDRIVKEFFKKQINAHIITKKPITACDQELAENPRSRSAKLRIIEKN